MPTTLDTVAAIRDALANARIAAPLDNALAHVVANGVRGDSRVIKSALASAAAGHTTIIVGVTAKNTPELFAIDGIPVLLAPLGERGSIGYPKDAALRSAWEQKARQVALYRKAVRVRRFVRGRPRGKSASPLAADIAWSKKRPRVLRSVTALNAALSVVRPRVIHTQDVVPLPATIAYRAAEMIDRRRRVRVLYDAHECCPELARSFPDSPAHQVLGAIEREYCGDADAVLTVSTEIAAILQREYALPHRPKVVTNGPSEVRDTEAPSLRSLVGVADDIPLAVYSGYVALERGLGTVIHALTLTPDIHLAIVVNAQSPALKDALKLADELGVGARVHLAPYVLPQQVTHYLSSATVGLIPLMPGDHFAYSLPTKFREYAHAGLPIIVSNHKTMGREIRRTGVGLAFRAGSARGLARQLRTVCDDRARFTANLTPELLHDYSWEQQVPTLTALYGEASGENATVEWGERASAAATPAAAPASATVAQRGLTGVWLGVGSAQHAGEAYWLAEAARLRLGIVAASFGVPRDGDHAPHRVTPELLDAAAAEAEFARAANAYTHVLIDGNDALFGPLAGEDVRAEVDLLARRVAAIGLVVHGEDLRGEDRRAASIDLAHRAGLTTFVSDPELAALFPHAQWLPRALDVDGWGALPPPPLGDTLAVLYLPASGGNAGSARDPIHESLTAIAARGEIVYEHEQRAASRQPEGSPITRADIVIDGNSTYDGLALEAMAAGRIVIGSLSHPARASVDRDFPLVEAAEGEVAEAVRGLMGTERDALQAMSASGRAYVNALHDGTRTAQVLEQWFLKARS